MFGPGEAAAWIEDEDSDAVLGEDEDSFFDNVVDHGALHRYIDAAYELAREQGHTFSRRELADEMTFYWTGLFREADRLRPRPDNFDALSEIYEGWAQGDDLEPAFSFGDPSSWD